MNLERHPSPATQDSRSMAPESALHMQKIQTSAPEDSTGKINASVSQKVLSPQEYIEKYYEELDQLEQKMKMKR